jgi:hypothetical protein
MALAAARTNLGNLAEPLESNSFFVVAVRQKPPRI